MPGCREIVLHEKTGLLVPVDDPQALDLRTYVNGELRQSNTTGKMIWTCAQLVEFFSTFVTLQPGVIISTGTPGGTADSLFADQLGFGNVPRTITLQLSTRF